MVESFVAIKLHYFYFSNFYSPRALPIESAPFYYLRRLVDRVGRGCGRGSGLAGALPSTTQKEIGDGHSSPSVSQPCDSK